MAEAAKKFLFRKRDKGGQSEGRSQLLESMEDTRVLLGQAYAGFNRADDPDLIESYVFEINSLQARYSYLLRRLKEEEAPDGRWA